MKRHTYAYFLVLSLFIFSCTDDNELVVNAEDIEITAGLAEAAITVSEGGLQQEITVDFGVPLTSNLKLNVAVSGTAEYGVHYTTSLDKSGDDFFISIPEGASSKIFTFTPVDNDELDDDKTAIFTITSDDERVTLESGEITVTIENDDFFTEIELFLMNSVKTELLFSGFCEDIVTLIDYDEEGIPTRISYDFPDFPQIDRVDEDPYFPSFLVNYDADSIWLTFEENDKRVNQEETEPFMVATISEGRYDRIKLNESIGRLDGNNMFGRLSEGHPSFYYQYTYDDNGRIERLGFYQGEVEEDAISYVYESDTEVEIVFDISVLRADIIPFQSIFVTLDGKNSPREGFALLPGLVSLFSANSEESFIQSIINFVVSPLPSNMTSSEIDLYSDSFITEWTYEYNSGNYPTGAEIESFEGFFNPREDGDIEGPPSSFFYSTYQYLDMDGGGEPVMSEDCFDPCENDPCACGRIDCF